MGTAKIANEKLANNQMELCWKIISLLKRNRLMITGLIALTIVAAGLDICVPFLTRGVIDSIVRSTRGEHFLPITMLLLPTLAIFGATTLARILRSVYNYSLFNTVSRIEDRVKNAAFANFLRLDTNAQSEVNTGEIVGALDRGGTAMFIVIQEIIGQNLIPPAIIFIGVMSALIARNPWIALTVLVPLPAYILTVSRLGTRMSDLEQDVNRSFETVSKESYDIASNVRVVKKFSRESEEAQLQAGLLKIARRKQFRGERLWAMIENLQSVISTAGRAAVIALGGYFVLTHRCTIGDYVLFISLQDMVYGPISQLSIILPKLRRNLARAERMFEILDQKTAVPNAPGAPRLHPVQHSVDFRNLSFRYKDADRWTLENVNFSVPAGLTVALIGMSGSGKSTLMNLLQRIYDPQAGGIFVDGVDIRDITQESLRSQIAVVPQEVELFSRSIAENIGYGRDGVAGPDIERAARMAQAHEFITRCDDGYDTQVGERGAKLSGGERQRIGIARAIVRDPKILILDEATSHLDNESERLIQIAMEQLTRNRTCFIIAHRLSTVRKADLVVVFADGGIEAIGTHDELWNTSETYRRLNGIHVASPMDRPRPVAVPERGVPEEVEMLVGAGF